jgi:multicomponent K+:H+ antiporter subunit D
VLRLSFLLFGDGAGVSAGLADPWLLYGGIATLGFGMLGVLAAQDMGRMAGFAVLVSSGTLLAAFGVDRPEVTTGALLYLVTSVLALAAFYLLVELIERDRAFGADMLAVTREAFGDAEADENEEEIGPLVPGMAALLGISFLASALLIAGLPPLSGFVAKLALLTAALNPQGMSAEGGRIAPASWALLALLILSGLASLIAMTRAGIRAFWAAPDRAVPRVRIIEMAPVAMLLVLCALQTIEAGPVMRFMNVAAAGLHAPSDDMKEVLQPAQRQMESPEVS